MPTERFTPEKNSKPKIGIGTVNMLGPDTFYAPMLPIEYFTGIAKKSGADGVEFWPMRGLTWAQLASGLISPDAKKRILSGHQSIAGLDKEVNGMRKAHEVFRVEGKNLGYLTTAGIWVYLPQRGHSMEYLRKLQTHTGNVPLVVFTEETRSETLKKSGGNNMVTQITPDSYRKNGSYRSLEDYLNDLDNQGIGYCIDTHHIRRQSEGTPFADWRKAVDNILQRAQQTKKSVHVHVSVGRVENDDINIETMREQQDLRTGRYEGNLFEMLRKIHQSNTANRYIIETPFPSLKAASGIPFATKQMFVNEFARMVDGLRNFLEKH